MRFGLFGTAGGGGASVPYQVPGLVGDWDPDAAGALTLTDPGAAFSTPLDLSQAGWAKNRVTISAVSDPFGGTSGWEMTETAFNDGHYVAQTPSPTPTATGLHEVSAYFKAGTREWAYLATNNAAQYAFFNVTTGQLGIKHVSVYGHEMVDAGSGWWFCRMWAKYNAANGCRMGMSSTNGLLTYLGDGTSTLSVYLPGIQAKLIDQIKDMKGGRHAVQSATANKPLWLPDYWAPGRGGIFTDGVSSFMTADAVATDGVFSGLAIPICNYYPMRIVTLAAFDNMGPAFGRSSAVQHARNDLTTSNPTTIRAVRSNDAGTLSTIDTTVQADTSKHYLTDKFTGTQRLVNRSGGNVVNAAQVITGTFTPDYYTLYAYRSAATPTVSAWVAALSGRLLVYNQVPSDVDNEKLERFVRDQYALNPPLLTQVTDTYFSGTPTFTTPAIIYSPSWVKNQVFPQCWGSGAGGTTDTGSGGGGAFAGDPGYNVLPSTGYAISVAAGGAVTADGADSTFDTTGVVAKGGLAAAGGSTGGTAAASTGVIKFNAGNGVVGTGTRLGGAGAGNKAIGNLQTGGADTSMTTSSAGGFMLAGGGPSTAVAQFAGRRGEVRVGYCIEAPSGYPYQPYPQTAGRDAADSTTRNVYTPGGNGGILLVYASGDMSPTPGNIDMPGWNKLAQLADGTGVVTCAWFWFDASVANPSALAITTSVTDQIVWQCERWYNAGTPEIATSTGASTNANPPSLTYSGGSKKIVWKVTAGLDTNGQPEFNAIPTNFTSMIMVSGQGTAGASSQQATAEYFFEAATLDPDPFGSTNENWVCATIAIPPA